MAVSKVLDLSTEKFIRDMTEINPKYDDSVIIKAYEIARKLHDGQFRKSGEPYIIHPVAVAKILAQFGMDNETVIAGLLHDVVEDTRYTREQLAEDFDEKIADLVEGVTKLTNISYDSSEAAQAENFRKMFLLQTSPPPTWNCSHGLSGPCSNRTINTLSSTGNGSCSGFGRSGRRRERVKKH